MEHILVVLTDSVGNIAKLDDIENFEKKEDMFERLSELVGRNTNIKTYLYNGNEKNVDFSPSMIIEFRVDTIEGDYSVDNMVNSIYPGYICSLDKNLSTNAITVLKYIKLSISDIEEVLTEALTDKLGYPNKSTVMILGTADIIGAVFPTHHSDKSPVCIYESRTYLIDTFENLDFDEPINSISQVGRLIAIPILSLKDDSDPIIISLIK